MYNINSITNLTEVHSTFDHLLVGKLDGARLLQLIGSGLHCVPNPLDVMVIASAPTFPNITILLTPMNISLSVGWP